MGKKLRKFMPLGKFKKQDGQILLVVILATVVALTVGLSAITRTITNTRLSTEEANSQKALAAAEAGIEQLLSDPSAELGEDTQLSNNSKFTAKSIAVEGIQFHLNDGNTILRDDGADIWLTNSPDFNNPAGGWFGNIRILWTGESADHCENAALEVVVIEGSRLDPSIKRFTGDPCITRNNGFDNSVGASQTFSDGKEFQYYIDITIPTPPETTGGYISRIIPLYEDAEIAVIATTPLPVQGHTIESVGVSGDTTRKLRVYQPNPRLPIEFFPYNVFLPEDTQ